MMELARALRGAAAQTLLAPMARAFRASGDAESALSQLGCPLDLIVTDLSLSGRIEGWRIAEAALTHWPHVRAIVVSGHLPQVDPLSARFPGRIATLAKPLTAETLATALASLPLKHGTDATLVQHPTACHS